jgi:ribosome-binding protein aMBF1 (putative translation factor)
VQSKTELAASIHNAMKAKHLSEHQLAEVLKTNCFMIDKLLAGDIVPSSHLEKQLIEVLGIPRDKVARLAERRSKQAQGG